VGTTAVTDGRRYDWVRLTYPRGQSGDIRVDEHGWFVPVPWHFAGHLNTFAPLDHVRDEPVVLLMSASGIGKSTGACPGELSAGSWHVLLGQFR